MSTGLGAGVERGLGGLVGGPGCGGRGLVGGFRELVGEGRGLRVCVRLVCARRIGAFGRKGPIALGRHRGGGLACARGPFRGVSAREVQPQPRGHGAGGPAGDEGYEVEAWGPHGGSSVRELQMIPIYYTQTQV